MPEESTQLRRAGPEHRQNGAPSPAAHARRLNEGTRSDAFAWALINAAPDGVIVVEESGVVVLANRRAEELLGYDRGELLTVTLEDLVPSGRRAAHAAHRLRYANDPYLRPMGDGQRLAARRRDGTEIVVEISLAPMYRDSSRLVIATIRSQRDMTHRDHELRLAEQERIGRELAQTAIQRLQTIGLLLAAARSGPTGRLAERCDDVIDTVDELIREIRDLVFAEGDGLG